MCCVVRALTGSEGVPVGEERDAVHVRLVPGERLHALPLPDVPHLGERQAESRCEPLGACCSEPGVMAGGQQNKCRTTHLGGGIARARDEDVAVHARQHRQAHHVSAVVDERRHGLVLLHVPAPANATSSSRLTSAAILGGVKRVAPSLLTSRCRSSHPRR